MSAETDVERLRDVGLFGGLSDVALTDLASAHAVVDLGPGAAVFREGEPGREMFVVLQGEVELSRKVHGAETRVALVLANDWFGEMSMLDILPRPTTATVVQHARLLRLTAQDLNALYRRDMKGYALLVLNIAREMSRRLRAADAVLAELGAPAGGYKDASRP